MRVINEKAASKTEYIRKEVFLAGQSWTDGKQQKMVGERYFQV